MRPTRRRIGVVFDPIDRNYFWFNPGSLTDFERFCRPEFISPARPFAQNNRSWRLRPASDGRCGKRSVGFDQTKLSKLGPEFGRDFGLQGIVVLLNLPIASRSYDESDCDIGRCRELKRSGAQIDTIASGYCSQLFALFDHHRGYPKILLAMVVARAPRYEAGVERGSNDERNVFLAHGRKNFVHGVGVINQRILSGAQTDIGIGVIDGLEDGLRRVHADAPSPYDALVAHLRQCRKGAFACDFVLLLPAVREVGEVWGNVVHERDVQAVHTEPL